MSPKGRPEGEFDPKHVSAEGGPVRPKGRPEGEVAPKRVSAEGSPVSFLDQVRWNADGLVPAIAQEAQSGRVLTLAWMNREALAATVDTGFAHYWSRSRRKLWKKGESSGHVQSVREIRLDCDNDAILLRVDQCGGIACHTGREHCFHQRYADGRWQDADPVLKDPQAIYGHDPS